MPRLLFEKTGNAIWMSHLDLMRVFQRSFKRAGLTLKHTQGFNPRPSVSIALPLSVGVASCCELLDFELDGQQEISCEEIRSKLNKTLVEGVRVIESYPNGRKLGELALLSCQIVLEYDSGIQESDLEQIRRLFEQSSLVLPKKTKNGIQDQDIIPLIRRLTFTQTGIHSITADAMICCQNPTLNPAQIVLAITTYLPELTPSLSRCRRMEIYDKQETIFR